MRLIPTTVFQPLTEMSSGLARNEAPALLTMTSSRPHSETARSTIALTWSSWRTSTATANVRLPRSWMALADRLQVLQLAAADGDVGAGARELDRDGLADAGAAAGDDRGLAFEREGVLGHGGDDTPAGPASSTAAGRSPPGAAAPRARCGATASPARSCAPLSSAQPCSLSSSARAWSTRLRGALAARRTSSSPVDLASIHACSRCAISVTTRSTSLSR